MKLFMRTMDDTTELRYHRFGELQRGSTHHHTFDTTSSTSPASSFNKASSSGRTSSKTPNSTTSSMTTPHEVKQRFMEGRSAYIGRQLDVLHDTMLDGSRRDVGQFPIERMTLSRTRDTHPPPDNNSSYPKERGEYDSSSSLILRAPNDGIRLRAADGAAAGTSDNAVVAAASHHHPSSKAKSTFFEEVAQRNATGSSLGLARGLIGDNEPAPRTRLRDGTTATSVPFALRGYVGR